MKKRIFILANKYPNVIEPNVCVFIQSLVWSFADLGYECSVICPMPINFNFKYMKFPLSRIEKNENGKNIKVYHPKYISLGQNNKFLQKFRVKFTTWAYTKACDKILKNKKLNSNNDILYSHFICPSGVSAAKLGKKYEIKSFMAHGEAFYRGDIKYGNKYLKKVFKNLTGVIAVSTQNKDYLVDAGVIEQEKIGIFPNGYREERFYNFDKKIARKHFGWDEDKFIVGFCGSFDERKGVLRLQQSVDKIDDKKVVFACAGKGSQMPTSSKCIWSKPVKNNELVYFYNAIDVFCLPTQNEGCCNAIVEAIACGCPIISSDRKFNYDILDPSNSIMIDPNNIEEISNAIIKTMNNKNIISKMRNSNLNKSKKLTLENRAKNIVKFFMKN